MRNIIFISNVSMFRTYFEELFEPDVGALVLQTYPVDEIVKSEFDLGSCISIIDATHGRYDVFERELGELRANNNAGEVWVFMLESDLQYIPKLLRAGIMNIILERHDILELKAILKAGRNKVQVCSTNLLRDYLKILPNNDPAMTDLFEVLTNREKEVLGFLGKGLRNKQICEQMKLSEATVKLYVKTLCKKLEVNNRTALVSLGHRYGFFNTRTTIS